MTERRLVFGVIFALAVIALLGYEGYALWTPETGDTISEIVWSRSCEGAAFVPFIVGFVMGGLGGHFFWQRKQPRQPRQRKP